jgi:signal peptidase
MVDKKKLHIVSASALAVLLIIFFIPFETAGRIIAAVAFASFAVVTCILIKKRSIPSMNKHQVLMIVSVITVVYLMLYYLTGLKFGFYKNPYALNTKFIFERAIPIAIIIVSSEIYRYVMRAQEDKAADVLCYISCVLIEMIACSTASVAISSFNRFMELIAETMFPALAFNLLYHYLTKRYGFYPNIVFRAGTTLYIYLIPYTPGMAKSLHAFVDLFVPIVIYLFISALFEKKRRYALGKKSRLAVPLTVLAVAAMLSVVMLISNQFRFGTLVIATESMTGELNKGDAAIYERYDDQIIKEGQVIVFEKSGSKIIHRVEEIEIINGTKRYYTKGDANDNRDTGYIQDGDIIGLVNLKIPYIGYPTLWMRSFFKR